MQACPFTRDYQRCPCLILAMYSSLMHASMPVHSRLTEMSLFNTCDVFFLDAPLLTGKGAKWRFFLAWDNNIASLTRKQKGRVPSDDNNRDYSHLCRENNFKNFKLMESVKWVNKHANGASATKRWWASEWSQPNKRMNHFDWKIDSLQGNKHLYENKIF